MIQVHTGRQKFDAAATCSKMLRGLQTSALFVKGRVMKTADKVLGHFHLQITASGG